MSNPPSDDFPLDGTLFGEGQPCFGCSPSHPHGLGLRFTREGDEIETRFTPDAGRQGPPGIMHGGLVSTVADELAAWTILAGLGKFGFTASFEAKFSGPIRIGQEVVGRGKIVKDMRRVVDVDVRLMQGEAQPFRGHFRFVLLDRRGAERLLGGPIPDNWSRFCR